MVYYSRWSETDFRIHLPLLMAATAAARDHYHGYNGTAKNGAVYWYGYGGKQKPDLLVYPQGVDSPPSWNAGVGTFGPTGDAVIYSLR